MFTRCQACWYFRYRYWDEKRQRYGIIIPPRSAMTRGWCVHKSLAFNFATKVQSHEDLPVDDVLDHYSTTFEEQSEETAWAESEDKGSVKDVGVRMLEHYQEAVAPDIQPVQVEYEFTVDMSWEEKLGDETVEKQMPFTGFIDLTTDKDVLIEHKTTGQTPKRPKGNDYWLGHEATQGKPPASARLDYIVGTKQPVVVSFESQIPEAQKRFLLNQIPRVVNAMESEMYYANRGNVYCTPNACGYWVLCHQIFGG
jgi:hypothetical protein